MNRPESDYWVIFDTCTEPEYYMDLHKILSMPTGWMIRYNYSRDLISDEAAQELDTQVLKNRTVLLMYGQYDGFIRGTNRKVYQLDKPMLWCPTRWAELVDVHRDADKYYFDLRLGGYPHFHPDAVKRIIDRLWAQEETPFRKWVALSGDLGSFDDLCQSTDAQNWDRIVSWLHTCSQFADDSFWRIERVVADHNFELMPKVLSKRSGQPVTCYDLRDGQRIQVSVSNREPERSDGGSRPSRTITISCDAKYINLQTPRLDLRQYFTQSAQFAVHSDSALHNRETTLTLSTTPPGGPFPDGPKLDLMLRLRRSYTRIGGGIVMGVIALACVAGAAVQAFEPAWRVAFGAFAATALVVAALLLRKDIQFK